MKQAFRNWFLCVTAIAALLSLTAATYAWFTSNQAVSTTRASARTAVTAALFPMRHLFRLRRLIRLHLLIFCLSLRQI